MSTNPIDRRRFTRIMLSIPAVVHFKEKSSPSLPAEILDISEGGAFVHCTAPIALGKEILLEIRFSESVILAGVVVQNAVIRPPLLDKEAMERSVVRWVRGSSHAGFGIEFVALQPETLKFVVRIVQYFAQLEKAGTSFRQE